MQLVLLLSFRLALSACSVFAPGSPPRLVYFQERSAQLDPRGGAPDWAPRDTWRRDWLPTDFDNNERRRTLTVDRMERCCHGQPKSGQSEW